MLAGGKAVIAFGTVFLATLSLTPGEANAASHHRHTHRASSAHGLRLHVSARRHHLAAIHGARVIQCVAFAKQDAGIEISGNARDWWGNAAGIYERGRRPEAGSVLSFSANGRMPLGHVAVVSEVADSRTITIDQSHWGRNGITRDIKVMDVSENNDWTAVRVQLSRGGAYGSIYPTHGFIYPRPDNGAILDNSTRAPMPAIDTAPSDLRPATLRHIRVSYEVAEAPVAGHALDLTVPGIAFDAPSRGLR